MRHLSSLAILMVCSVSAQAADLTATSRVDQVTVFLSGAEVTRLAEVNIDKGEHVLTIVDIPASAVPGSIRVEGAATGKLEITSVDTQRKYLARADAQAADAERKKIEDQIEVLRDEKVALDAAITASDTQKALIANLVQLPARPAPATGQSAGEDWTRILSLIAQGSADASRAQIEAQVKARDVERRIEDLEKRLAGFAPLTTEQTELKVHLSAASPLEADLTVRYQVMAAGWTPLYDARLRTGSKTEPASLDLSRRAAVTQRTGEVWQDAAIQLSTARPSAGASAPELYTQTVDFELERKPVPLAKARRMEREASDTMAAAAPEPAIAAAPAAEQALQEIEEQAANLTVAPFEATFSVPGRISVPSTGEAKRVVLSTEKYEPQLSCRTVPKVDAQAFLYAKVSVAKGTPLLPGQVYLFRDGTFVGTGSLPQLAPGEQHELGFGVDDQVKVRHAILEEKSGESGLISSSRTDVRNYRVTAKNMHERAINLVVIDQMPVSLNQEIKVEYTGRITPAKTNWKDQRGVMTFEAKLEPDEEKAFDYGYRISWPAAKSVVYGQ